MKKLILVVFAMFLAIPSFANTWDDAIALFESRDMTEAGVKKTMEAYKIYKDLAEAAEDYYQSEFGNREGYVLAFCKSCFQPIGRKVYSDAKSIEYMWTIGWRLGVGM